MKKENKNLDKDFEFVNNAFNNKKPSVINYEKINTLSEKELIKINLIEDLKFGQKLSDNEVKSIFKCSLQSGMNRCIRTNSLVLIDKHSSKFNNRWEGDIIHYTGMGLTGDQSLDFMQNKTLNESTTNGVNLYLFEQFVPKEYHFRGRVKLESKPYIEEQIDFKLNKRKVWMFPLKVIDYDFLHISKNDIDKIQSLKENNVKKLSKSIIKSIAEGYTPKKNKRKVSSYQSDRNPIVNKYAKKRANGICQLCDQLAPFTDKNKEPFLEVHHVEFLRDNGKDSWDNVVALCPNCHRKVHSLKSDKDKAKLKELAKQKLV